MLVAGSTHPAMGAASTVAARNTMNQMHNCLLKEMKLTCHHINVRDDPEPKLCLETYPGRPPLNFKN